MLTREFFIANSDDYGFDAFDEKPAYDPNVTCTGFVAGTKATRYSTDDISKLTGFRPEAGKVYKIRIDIVEQPPE